MEMNRLIDVKFNNHVIPFIEEHAKQNKGKEIYGWLLGYEDFINSKNLGQIKIQRVIAAYSCHTYLEQTTINAEPDPQELSALIGLLPKKIYNIGMYHSHPVGVFHSHTDDQTLLQMKKIYPEVISIVTNGDQTFCYKTSEKQVKEVDIEIDHVEPLFSLIKVETKISISKMDNYYKIASQFEKELELKLVKEWDLAKIGERNFRLELDPFEYGSDYTFPFVVRTTILGTLNQLSKVEIIEGVKKAGYELVASLNKPKHVKTLQTGVINYFGIPTVIFPNSYAREKAKDRSKLISMFNEKSAKMWSQIRK